MKLSIFSSPNAKFLRQGGVQTPKIIYPRLAHADPKYVSLKTAPDITIWQSYG